MLQMLCLFNCICVLSITIYTQNCVGCVYHHSIQPGPVLLVLSPGCSQGEDKNIHVDVQIGLGKAFLLLVLYFLFVLMVLAADIWHRIRCDPDVTLLPCAVVQPMLAAHVMTSGNAICCRHVEPCPVTTHRSIWLRYMVSCGNSSGVDQRNVLFLTAAICH